MNKENSMTAAAQQTTPSMPSAELGLIFQVRPSWPIGCPWEDVDADKYALVPELLGYERRIMKFAAQDSLALASVPDDIRAAGWTVAVHNDYRLNGQAHTFWLFTNAEDFSVKGEGLTDAEALNKVRIKLGLKIPVDLQLTSRDSDKVDATCSKSEADMPSEEVNGKDYYEFCSGRYLAGSTMSSWESLPVEQRENWIMRARVDKYQKTSVVKTGETS